MKKCAYCGAEYPDDVQTCTVDGQSLTIGTPTPDNRKKINGVWRGVYGYHHAPASADRCVAFTLKLKQGWLGHFTGSVTEDPPFGAKGTGQVDGYFSSPQIEFVKQMPEGAVRMRDGQQVTWNQYLLNLGLARDRDVPSALIHYEGALLDSDRMQGIWIIRPRQVRFSKTHVFNVQQTSGTWCAQFITTDYGATPNFRPNEPFYDRALLPEPVFDPATDLKDKGRFRHLGSFGIPEAKHILNRFEQMQIEFQINSEGSPTAAMSPANSFLGGYFGTAEKLDIYVRMEDELKAKTIVNEGTTI